MLTHTAAFQEDKINTEDWILIETCGFGFLFLFFSFRIHMTHSLRFCLLIRQDDDENKLLCSCFHLGFVAYCHSSVPTHLWTEHPCCDWNCSTGQGWIKLPGTGRRFVCEQSLHETPIGSARPSLIPASGRQLAYTYCRSRQTKGETRAQERNKDLTQNAHPHNGCLTPWVCYMLFLLMSRVLKSPHYWSYQKWNMNKRRLTQLKYAVS